MLQPDDSPRIARQLDAAELLHLNPALTWHEGESIVAYRENDSFHKLADRLRSLLRGQYHLRSIMEERDPTLIDSVRATYDLGTWIDPIPEEFKGLEHEVSYDQLLSLPDEPLARAYQGMFFFGRPFLGQALEYVEQIADGDSLLEEIFLRNVFLTMK